MNTKIPSKEQLLGFESELEQLRIKTLASLGEYDEQHIKKMILIQRCCEVGGRTLLMGSIIPPLWFLGTGLLSVSKILDNMEIGHNVMHGQYDWMHDNRIHSSNFEWDTACDGGSWRQTHNFEHHTYTNIIGKDRDYGYGILRLNDEQPFRSEDYFNVIKFFMLSAFFQWGVALHELETDRIKSGEIQWKDKQNFLKSFAKKGARQFFKDYLFFPTVGMITGATLPIFLGNLTANFVRNMWASAVIFCGHFPEGSHTFNQHECTQESKGQWYYRQILGSCNFDGTSLLHIMSGHLSCQIEHHLFPDIPSSRYRTIAIDVQNICKKYDIPYNTDSFTSQYLSVLRKVIRHSVPNKQYAIA